MQTEIEEINDIKKKFDDSSELKIESIINWILCNNKIRNINNFLYNKIFSKIKGIFSPSSFNNKGDIIFCKSNGPYTNNIGYESICECIVKCDYIQKWLINSGYNFLIKICEEFYRQSNICNLNYLGQCNNTKCKCGIHLKDENNNFKPTIFKIFYEDDNYFNDIKNKIEVYYKDADIKFFEIKIKKNLYIPFFNPQTISSIKKSYKRKFSNFSNNENFTKILQVAKTFIKQKRSHNFNESELYKSICNSNIYVRDSEISTKRHSVDITEKGNEKNVDNKSEKVNYMILDDNDKKEKWLRDKLLEEFNNGPFIDQIFRKVVSPSI